MTSTVALKPGAASVAHQGIAMPALIPFRKTAVVSGSEVAGLVITTLLLLAVIAVSAWFARRQGWLDRWIGGAQPAVNSKRSLAVLEVLRISRKTTLYRLSNGTREFLLAESSAQIQLSPSDGSSEQDS